jgi:hypothetical protein
MTQKDGITTEKALEHWVQKFILDAEKGFAALP